jgi:phosphoglycolate phosphatase
VISFVVFDLDGTLIDGYAGISAALEYAMGKLGLPAPGSAEVRGMVGEGLERLIEKAAGAENVEQGVRLFRERYGSVAVEGSRLMPDVPEVLAELARRDVGMAVASNKPAKFSRQILEAKGILRFFRAVGGPGEGVPPKPAPAMLVGILERAGAHPSTTLVVGDMEIDSKFGRAAGCGVVLVATGSRPKAELARADCDALIDRLGQLPGLLESTTIARS